MSAETKDPEQSPTPTDEPVPPGETPEDQQETVLQITKIWKNNKTGEILREEATEIPLEMPVPKQPVAYAYYKYGRTVNLLNFESAQVHVALNWPFEADPDKVDEAFAYAEGVVTAQMEKEIKPVEAFRDKRKKEGYT